MRGTSLVVVILVVIGFGASTRPATAPTTQAIRDLQAATQQAARVEDRARSELESARSKAAGAFRSGSDGKRLTQAVKDAEAAKAAADSTAERLDKGKQVLDDKRVLAKAEGEADAADTDVIACSRMLDDAIRERARAESRLAIAKAAHYAALRDEARQEEAERMKDPIYRGIKSHEMVIGMTLEQAKQALDGWAGLDKPVAERDGGIQVYEPSSSKYYSDIRTSVESNYRLTFRDGKLVAISRWGGVSHP